jgi:tetratricopeptide (TPR) repeat protein
MLLRCCYLFLWINALCGTFTSLKAQNQDELDSLFFALELTKVDSQKVAVLNQIALSYQGSMPTVAHQYAQQALTIAEKQQYKQGIADAYLCLAGCYYFQGNILKDSEYLLKALPLYQQLADSAKIAKVFGYLGTVYEKQGDIEKQLEYLHKALKIAKTVGDEQFVATVLSNGLGEAYMKNGDLTKALLYHQEALGIREKIHDHWGLANSFWRIGMVYMNEKKYEEGKYYFLKSLDLSRKIADLNGLATTYLTFGDLFLEQKQYKKAQIYYDSSLQVAEEGQLPPAIQEAYNRLAKVYMSLEDYQLAYQCLQTSTSIKDSLENSASKKKIAELQAAFEMQEQQSKLAKEQAERERKNALQYSGILFFTLFLFVLVFIFGRFNVASSFVEKLLFFSFLLFFEFVLLLTDPYVTKFTQNEPLFILLANAMLALLIVPLHQYLENRLKNKWFSRNAYSHTPTNNDARTSSLEMPQETM